MNRALRTFLTNTKIGSILLTPYRFKVAARYHVPQVFGAFVWSFRSREIANFTYELAPENICYLAHTVASVTGASYSCTRSYIAELEQQKFPFGRRLGWYAFARILKPSIIVETGVDQGLGSIALCSALLRNRAEGHPGRYFGTDINPKAGRLFVEPYSGVGEILYGDSLRSLESIPSIDLFINDSDHSADYERREYEAVCPKLTAHAIILGDNAHCTEELAKFSQRTGRRFVFFKEQPHKHWYPGAGIGISY